MGRKSNAESGKAGDGGSHCCPDKPAVHLVLRYRDHGLVAQLGERAVRNGEVAGSTPAWSTMILEVVKTAAIALLIPLAVIVLCWIVDRWTSDDMGL